MYLKKLICLLLVTIMVVTLGLQSPAAAVEYNNLINPETGEAINSRIIKDNNKWRVVETWDNETKSVVTFDKKINKLVAETTNLETGKVDVLEIQLPVADELIDPNPITIQSTFSGQNLNGEYRYTNNTITRYWTLRIPNDFKGRYETTQNVGDLLSFRSSVLDLRGAEITLQTAIGSSLFSLAVALLTVPEPWTTVAGLLLAAGVIIVNIGLYYNVWRYANDCRFFFGRV